MKKSSGLWLNVPDYDAPTQLAKPNERNFRHVDCVLTVPSGSLYPMCGMNLAFDRKIIGPAMWFGLMGRGQPLGRYDDMWAGWCSKVVCDHLGLGVKTGKPFIWHSKASDPLANLEREFKGIMWQEAMVDFFRRVELPREATTASQAYAALARELRRSDLPKIDPYFLRVAEGMETWLEVWEEFNPEEEREEGEGAGRPRAILSREERASARGPAPAAAVLLAAAAAASSSSSPRSSASPALSHPAAEPASKHEGDDQENTAPFTPLVPSRPQQPLADKEAAAKELAASFERKAAV